MQVAKNRRNMKRIAFLALVLVAAVIAKDDDYNIEKLAEVFETDVGTIQACLDNAETTFVEFKSIHEKLEKLEDDDLDEETKKNVDKYGRFVACMMEKKELIKDSKLILDKILEIIEKDKSEMEINKEDLIKCVNLLNEDTDLTREGRALGLIICMTPESEEKK